MPPAAPLAAQSSRIRTFEDGPLEGDFGNTHLPRYKRTYAHELGHNFGLGHSSSTIAPDVGWDVYRPAGRLGLGHVMPRTK